MNTINKDTLGLIKTFEGLELSAYPDAVGVWTIGYGHTAMAGDPKPVAGMKITKQEAEDLLLHDLKKYEEPVKKLVTVKLNDNQYGALVSFVYNLGAGNFAKSSLLRRLNKGEYDAVPSEMMKWNKADGKVLNGLTRRRTAESVLWRKAVSATEVVTTIVNVEPITTTGPVAIPVVKKWSFWRWLFRMEQ